MFISCLCFQALLEQKRRQEEKELRDAAAARRKDKEEERLARERVKAQLEQDKLDKRVKFQVPPHFYHFKASRIEAFKQKSLYF